jgi:hypothetical protein
VSEWCRALALRRFKEEAVLAHVVSSTCFWLQVPLRDCSSLRGAFILIIVHTH